MHRLDIYRLLEHGQDNGTFSRWTVDDEPFCVGVELPWLNNREDVSCVPAGTYFADLVDSPAHGLVYELRGVPQRTNIQIHVANFAHELRGCLAPGKEISTFRGGVKGVTFSRVTLGKLMEEVGGEKTIQVCIHALAWEEKAMKDEIREVLKDGIEQGQAEVGQPQIPLTKEDREEVGKKIVAAWYVRLWRYLFG